MSAHTEQMSRSVADGWQRFRKALAGHAVLPPNVEQRLRDTYYAGAAVMLDLLTLSPEIDASRPDADGVALIERLHRELDAFAVDLAARLRTKGRPS